MRKLTLLVGLVLSSCASNLVLAPDGNVPKRLDLPSDPYGGYITIIASGETISGELIGVRNDSLVVLYSNQAISKPLDQVTYGQLIAHDPNSYLAGALIPMIPNALLLTIGGYGASPLVTALVFSGINLGGMGIASATENRKINYFEWEKEKEQLLKYARFPGGIPEKVNLGSLTNRPIPAKSSKKGT
ncbi:hypothetical protein GYM62_11940 [Algoriphagus sp. NBT04N3]|jgi:hypothetical protein|uniref:hypothetical protein n=1 Tax=Algoriphagus sp. NBT04N3 TaxID=2705473 RepID=UPI001C62CB1F|nr:hypothetical protein [Algoriphagus sp. NBT04N3]QYH39459.1 hypothetical protein GYM62_11940 [Algoriphagus sp. NBT04N3]